MKDKATAAFRSLKHHYLSSLEDQKNPITKQLVSNYRKQQAATTVLLSKIKVASLLDEIPIDSR